MCVVDMVLGILAVTLVAMLIAPGIQRDIRGPQPPISVISAVFAGALCSMPMTGYVWLTGDFLIPVLGLAIGATLSGAIGPWLESEVIRRIRFNVAGFLIGMMILSFFLFSLGNPALRESTMSAWTTIISDTILMLVPSFC